MDRRVVIVQPIMGKHRLYSNGSSAELKGEARAAAAAGRPAEAEVLPSAAGAAHSARASAEEGLEDLVGVDVLREGVTAAVALEVL